MNRTKQTALIIASVLLVAGLVFGTVQLFRLSFSSGSSYQPYSSLRSDPLGAKVLHDSLAICTGAEVERNYSPIHKLNLDRDTTLALLACRGFGRYIPTWHDDKDLKQFVRRGGRLVISLFPRQNSPYEKEDDDDCDEEECDVHGTMPPPVEEDGETSPTNSVKSEDCNEVDGVESGDDLEKQVKKQKHVRKQKVRDVWKLKLKDVTYTGPTTARLSPELRDTGLPALLECQSTARLEELDDSWKIIYAVDDDPVIVERTMGSGTIVFSTLSFPFSNEAMRGSRSSELLAWVLGRHGTVVFDEYHHGIVSSPGIASLARGYSMEWVLAGLFILAILFVWKSSSRLVPAESHSTDEIIVSSVGKDSASGLKNLLRRNILPNDLLDTCLREWEKDVPYAHLSGSDRQVLRAMIQAERAKYGRARDYAALYNRIAEFIKEGSRPLNTETDTDSQEE